MFNEVFVTLEHLLQLNHLIVEPHLELLWTILWVNEYEVSIQSNTLLFDRYPNLLLCSLQLI